jgi:exopolysaccharide production protein ExoQ
MQVQAFGGFDRLIYGQWLDKPGDKLTQSLNLMMIMSSLWLFWQGCRRARRLNRSAKLAIALSAFILLTTVWSVDPATSLRRSVLFLWMILGSIGIAYSMDGDEFMRLLVRACGLALLLSLVLLAISPGSALETDGSMTPRGVFPSKQQLGEVMVIGIVGALHGLRSRRPRRFYNITMVLLFLVVAFAAHSATALLTSVVVIVLNGILTLLHKGGGARLAGIFLLTLLAPLVLLFALDPSLVLESVGKDPTLTGRTELWDIVWTYIYQRPMLGWGYAAFWSAVNPEADVISRMVRWSVVQAHNGLLEALLQIGVLGTLYFSYLLLRAGRLAIRCGTLGTSTLLCLVAITTTGISETVMLDPFEATTGVFFILAIMCDRACVAAAAARASSYAGSRLSLSHNRVSSHTASAPTRNRWA